MKPATDLILRECRCDWSHYTLGQLMGHIRSIHHAAIRHQLRHIERLVQTCVPESAMMRPGVIDDIRRIVSSLAQTLNHQIENEQQILFPRIQGIEGEFVQASAVQERSLGLTISHIQRGHRFAGEAMARLWWLTAEFSRRVGRGSAYDDMMSRLEALDAELSQLVREEKDELFPRVMDLESALLLTA